VILRIAVVNQWQWKKYWKDTCCSKRTTIPVPVLLYPSLLYRSCGRAPDVQENPLELPAGTGYSVLSEAEKTEPQSMQF
jgi:hypothetical protein